MLISVLVPLYNEEEFVATLLEKVVAAPLPDGIEREILVVDDGSTDGSAEAAEEVSRRHPGLIRLIRHERNRGKGAAIRTALAEARGEFSIIQDADLEYDPREYAHLLNPLLEGKADAVYGSRFMVAAERRVLYFWHSLANRVVTGLCNLAADLNLTDMESCYKAVRTSLLRSIPLRSDRFGFEPEVTIKLAKRQVRIYETPISYHGRTYEEGKKIGFRDALETVWVILRYSFTQEIYKDTGAVTLHALSGARRFNRWMADTVRPYLGESVLEIGAGIGNLTRQLASRRRRYIATDIDEEYLARLRTRFHHRPNLEIRKCDLEDPRDFEPLAGAVDSVVCLNVLEHVRDDVKGLRSIRSALRPGGRAIVLVPQDPKLFGTLDVALGHHRRYGPDELRASMERAGLRLEQMVKFNRVSRPGWYLHSVLLKRSSLNPVQIKIFDRGVWLWRRIDRWLPWDSTSIIAIGVKEG